MFFKREKMTRLLLFCIFIWSIFGCLCLGQTYLGNFTGFSIVRKAATVYADSSALRFIFYRSDIVRVDFLPSPATISDSSFVVVQDTVANVAVSVIETDSTLSFFSSNITIICGKYPLRVSYYTAAGKPLLAEPAGGGIATFNKQRMAKFSLAPDDHFYGTGERGTALDKRGQAFQSYNTQNYGYTQPLATMNVNVPFILSMKGYGLYFDNTYSGNFDFGVANPNEFYYSVSGGELSYYFMTADTLDRILERFTWLTGCQPLPPRWAFGFIQSKYGYQTASEATSIVQKMRQDQIPCDAIVLDLYWYNNMGDLTWNSASWPDPFPMISGFLSQGIKTIVITEPYIVQPSINFSAATSNGYLAKNGSGNPYLLSNWWSCGCNAGLVDLSNPSARTWWWNKHPVFMGDSMGGIWSDLGEPEQHPPDMIHYLGTALKIHNIYNFLWAKTLFDGYQQSYPGRRFFNLTRSGFAGIQRFGAILWSGDVRKSFGGLAVQPPMLLNMGMSGLAYHNSDIGGFCCGTTTPELYARWMEYGTFCPLTRAHGSSQATEPWAFGDSVENICKKFIGLRYQLLPYIYTIAYQNYTTGTPLARPLLFDDPLDPNLVNESSSYLWGNAFLVSPVVQSGQTSKNVYLPKGSWVDYWSDQEYQGGQSITVAAPLDKLPLFVKSGSVIPMQPVMNYTDEHPLDTLILQCYTDSVTPGSFTLYEDDGKSLQYQSGGFAQTLFSQRMVSGSDSTKIEITIGSSEGNFSGKLTHRVYLTDIHRIRAKPSIVMVNNQSVQDNFSLALLRQSGNGFFYDDSSEQLFVQATGQTDSSYHIIAQIPSTSTGVLERDRLSTFRLEQNYPNPFNPSTTIDYQIRLASFVSLKVFNILGQEVAVLQNSIQQPGKYSLPWAAGNFGGGVYFYRLTAVSLSSPVKAFTTVKSMILIK